MREDGLEESEQGIYVELGEDQSAGYGSVTAGESFGTDISAGPDGGFDAVDRDGEGRAFDEEFDSSFFSGARNFNCFLLGGQVL